MMSYVIKVGNEYYCGVAYSRGIEDYYLLLNDVTTAKKYTSKKRAENTMQILKERYGFSSLHGHFEVCELQPQKVYTLEMYGSIFDKRFTSKEKAEAEMKFLQDQFGTIELDIKIVEVEA